VNLYGDFFQPIQLHPTLAAPTSTKHPKQNQSLINACFLMAGHMQAGCLLVVHSEIIKLSQAPLVSFPLTSAGDGLQDLAI